MSNVSSESDSLQLKSDRYTILVVDDAPFNLAYISALLKNDYRVALANSGSEALDMVSRDLVPDLILLDVVMTGIDGYEVCTRLKSDPQTRNIPVIFLTAKSEIDDEKKGLDLGAVDYITKPVSPPILKARLKAQLALKAAEDFLRDKNNFLEQEIARRTQEITAIQDVSIMMLASLSATRDVETGNHILRTQQYVKVLADHLKTHPRFADFLTERNVQMLFKSAPLHDIGKIGIPDRILLKTDKLTAEEFEFMKSHTTLGRDAINHAESMLGMPLDFLNITKEIALSHHEKWDGTGYPEGLSGDDIPISARLMAVADVYDALMSRRVYKDPMLHAHAVDIIRQGRGQHFDPDVVSAFVEANEVFRQIAERYADSDDEIEAKASMIKKNGV